MGSLFMRVITPVELVFQGRSRLVYIHPGDPTLLLKIEREYPLLSAPKVSLAWRSFFRKYLGFYSTNRAELKAHLKISLKLSNFIPTIRPELVDTSLGQALVVSRIMNGSESAPSLHQIMQSGSRIDSTTMDSVRAFCECCNRHEINLFDLNPANFLLRSDKTVVFSDLKSLNVDRSLIPLTRVFKSLAKRKRLRRQARLFRLLESYTDR